MGVICLAFEVLSYFYLYHYRSILNGSKIIARIRAVRWAFEPVTRALLYTAQTLPAITFFFLFKV